MKNINKAKMLLAALVATISLNAKAADAKFPRVSQITEGHVEIQTLYPKCASGTPRHRCLGTSYANVSLALNGCLDKALASYSVVRDQDAGKTIVIISALNVHSEKSQVMCMVMPIKRLRIELGKGFFNKNNVEVVFLDKLEKQLL